MQILLGPILVRMSQVSFQTMLVVYTLLILSGCWLAFVSGRRHLMAWPALIFFSLIWFRVNHRWEGRILYTFRPTHGLTEADLVVPVVIVAALLVRIGRAASRRLR